jgi:uncharacterized protein
VTPTNPFFMHRPLQPDEMIRRDEEATAIIRLIEGGQATRISAPRRYGKTSLLNQVVAELGNSDTGGTVYVDFTGVQDASDAALRIELAYRESLGGWLKKKVSDITDLLEASLTVGAGPAKASLGSASASANAGMRRFYKLLEMPVQIQKRTGQRCAVIFDEFQDLVRADSGLEGVLRSRIQHHGDAASYVFAGSHPGMMAAIFGHRERPLYGQARPVVLGPVAHTSLVEHVVSRMPGGDEARDVVESLVNIATGHPQRTMLLAHLLFEQRVQSGQTPTADDVLAVALAELDEQFSLLWSQASPAQRALLGRLVRPRAQQGDAGQIRHLEPAEQLFAKGDLVEREGQMLIADPLLACWIAQRTAPNAPSSVRELTAPAPTWDVGNTVFHPSIGPGVVVDADPGEGFGEQRGYLTVQYRGGIRAHLPLSLAAREPGSLRADGIGPADIAVLYDQLTVPAATLFFSRHTRLSALLSMARTIAEAIAGILAGVATEEDVARGQVTWQRLSAFLAGIVEEPERFIEHGLRSKARTELMAASWEHLLPEEGFPAALTPHYEASGRRTCLFVSRSELDEIGAMNSALPFRRIGAALGHVDHVGHYVFHVGHLWWLVASDAHHRDDLFELVSAVDSPQGASAYLTAARQLAAVGHAIDRIRPGGQRSPPGNEAPPAVARPT